MFYRSFYYTVDNMFQTIVNLKVYNESTGKNTEILLKTFNTSESSENVKFAVPLTKTHLGKHFKNLISQHVDPESYGPYTGHVIMEELISSGIKGSLLNHSERRVSKPIIRSTIARAEELGFKLIICSKDLEEIREVCDMGADIIAYEPTELIGGKISVATAKPHIIEQAVALCDKYKSTLLVGAGINNKKDVETSKGLGAGGILVSSGVVKSKDPFHSLNSLMI